MTCAKTVLGAGTGVCADGGYAFERVEVELRAKDPAALLREVDSGELPACILGNDAGVEISISLEGGVSIPYFDAPVYYESKSVDAFGLEVFTFETTREERIDETVPRVTVSVTPGVFSEPPVGAEFWATRVYDSPIQILRDSQHGPLRLLVVDTSLPLSDSISSALNQALGAQVIVEPSCNYVNSREGGLVRPPASLWDASFLADTTIRVHSGSVGQFENGGRLYAAWVAPSLRPSRASIDSTPSLRLAVYAR
jgi:hypothetical protein